MGIFWKCPYQKRRFGYVSSKPRWPPFGGVLGGPKFVASSDAIKYVGYIFPQKSIVFRAIPGSKLGPKWTLPRGDPLETQDSAKYATLAKVCEKS
jgi:hypothetical protein